MDKVKATLFGTFQISFQNKILEENEMHSSKLVALFSFMMIYHARVVSVTEMMDILWNNEEITNPRNALKNLTYRLRKVLQSTFGVSDFFLTQRGSYSWNPDYEIELDIEQFETMEKELKEKEQVNQEDITRMCGILSLYKGKLLPSISSSHWVISLITYFHSLYLRNAKQLALLCGEAEDYDNMSEICKNALLIDPLDDETQYLFIKALLLQGHVDLAKKQYQTASRMMYESLGIRQSEYLQKIYMEIMKKQEDTEENLDTIKDDLLDDPMKKAFQCEYGVFREIYHLDMRRSERHGYAEYVVLFTLTQKKFAGSDSNLSLLNKEMKKLETVVMSSLRNGDVVSKYSGNQYIMLLYGCNAENIQIIVDRLISRYEAQSKFHMFEIEYTYDEIGA